MGPILADGAAVVVGSAGPRCSTRLVPGGAPLSEEAFAGTLRAIVGLRRTRKYSRENATGQGGSTDSGYRVAFDGCLCVFASLAGGRGASRCGARGDPRLSLPLVVQVSSPAVLLCSAALLCTGFVIRRCAYPGMGGTKNFSPL